MITEDMKRELRLLIAYKIKKSKQNADEDPTIYVTYTDLEDIGLRPDYSSVTARFLDELVEEGLILEWEHHDLEDYYGSTDWELGFPPILFSAKPGNDGAKSTGPYRLRISDMGKVYINDEELVNPQLGSQRESFWMHLLDPERNKHQDGSALTMVELSEMPNVTVSPKTIIGDVFRRAKSEWIKNNADALKALFFPSASSTGVRYRTLVSEDMLLEYLEKNRQ